jgi:carbon-monoxide dehydrogenase medium subunit
VPAREFFVDFQQTALTHGDLITAIEIPRQPSGAGACFAKLSSLSANDWPCASAAALVVDQPKHRREIRLGLGALSHVPLYTSFVLPADTDIEDVVVAARDAAGPLLEPIPDVRGGAEFKRRLGLVAVEDAVRGSWKEQQDDRRGPLRTWRRRR